jgi:hypothetical protein
MTYGNPKATVTCTYREFFAEAMTILPNLRFIPQGQAPIDELLNEVAVTAFLKDAKAPCTREVMSTYRKYGEVMFRP